MSYDPLTTTSPVYTGPRVLSYPFSNDGDLTHVVAEQKYIVQAESYTPPALNTTITVNAVTLYLVGDYNHSEIESGCIEFVRRWASIPANRNSPIETSFTFPAFLNLRNSFTSPVPAIVLDEYFLVGPSLTYTSFDLIPFVNESKATFTSGGPYPLGAGNFFLNNGGAGVDTSTPSLDTYLGQIASDATPQNYSIVTRGSELERYMGNIWRRRTTRCKAL